MTHSNFCKQYYLPPTEWLDCLDLPVSECGNFSNFRDRLIQVVDNFIRVSHNIKNFDRWSNSVEYVFDLTETIDREVLVNFIQDGTLPEDVTTYTILRYNQCQ